MAVNFTLLYANYIYYYIGPVRSLVDSLHSARSAKGKRNLFGSLGGRVYLLCHSERNERTGWSGFGQAGGKGERLVAPLVEMRSRVCGMRLRQQESASEMNKWNTHTE